MVCDEDGLVTLVYAVPPRLAELGIRLAELKPEDPEYQVVADDGINSRLIVRIGNLGTSALRKVVRLRLRRVQQACWRIVISPMIPQDFPSCYYSAMRNLAVLVIHLIATLARLLGLRSGAGIA